MIVSRVFSGRHYAVLGLARSGLATVGTLIESGARVTAWDDRPEARATASALGAEIGDPATIALDGVHAIVVSPGVPINRHPVADRARAAGVPLIGDIELFARARVGLPAHRVVGVTGTNGKSTTTALIHHILTVAGVPARMGGNIGLPILSQEPLPAGGVYVLELSSYQIDLTASLAVDVAVLTNITPDHLDRYDGSFDAYVAAKERLFAMQGPRGVAVFATDDAPSREMADRVALLGHPMGRVSGTDIRFGEQSEWPALAGPHNAQNAACAIAAARVLGVGDEAIRAALRSFGGLPHRLERVATRRGVLFVNDSKATNAASTATALAAYPPERGPRIHWIVGGQAKGDGLDACAPWFDRIARAYVIGEAADAFAARLAPVMPVTHSGTLEQAVREAAVQARSGDVVLLSPACASFDQFRDFEHRGQAFRDAVAALPDAVIGGGFDVGGEGA